MFGSRIGSRKYKTKFTERLNIKPRSAADSLASGPGGSTLTPATSVEPLDLRRHFFSQDDTSSIMSETKTPDAQPEERRGSYFNRMLGKGYNAPTEQSAEPVKFLGIATPYSSTNGDPERRPNGLNFNPQQSYRLEQDSSDPSRTDPFPGTTPLESPNLTEETPTERNPFEYDIARGASTNNLATSEHPAGHKPSYGGSAYTQSISPVRSPSFYSNPPSHYASKNVYPSNPLKNQLAGLTFIDSKSKGSLSSYDSKYPPPYDEETSYNLKHQKGRRGPVKWYGVWSTRKMILAVVAVILFVGLVLGLVVGLLEAKNSRLKVVSLSPHWRPAIGTTFHIELNEPVTAFSREAYIYDMDLFDNPMATIQTLHTNGKRVICYFSAGTYESWRSDASKFPKAAIGQAVEGRTNESYVDITNKDVVNIMHTRIALALQKGCDGVDPGNINSYETTTGFPLTEQNAIDYVNDLAKQAHTMNMAVGLNNAPGLINGTIGSIEWQIRESCAMTNTCGLSHSIIQTGKPVFHIEYAPNATATVLKMACNANGTHLFTTMLKHPQLDMWAATCPFGDPAYEAW